MNGFNVDSTISRSRSTLRGGNAPTLRRSDAPTLFTLALALLPGCETTPKTSDRGEAPVPVPPASIVFTARDLEQASERYLTALEAFGVDDPAGWEKARRELESGWEPLLQVLADAESPDPAVRAAAGKRLSSGEPLGTPANPYCERLDVLVLRKTLSADPAEAARAREELRRKGRVHRLLRNFNTFDYALWQKTRLELVTLGDYGASQCVLSLLRQLFLADARRQPLIRSEIAELGERAIPPVMEILRRRGAEKRRPGDAPMTATLGKVEQCIRILAELGPAARDELGGIAGEEDPSLRFLVAKALKDAKDPKTGELVTTWEVKR